MNKLITKIMMEKLCKYNNYGLLLLGVLNYYTYDQSVCMKYSKDSYTIIYMIYFDRWPIILILILLNVYHYSHACRSILIYFVS